MTFARPAATLATVHEPASCCAPASRPSGGPAVAAAAPAPSATGPRPPLIRLPGGAFRMGNDDERSIAGDREGPVRTVEVAPFRVAACAVTVAQFAAFV